MGRVWSLVCGALVVAPNVARAQSGEAIAGTILAGYGLLSISAIVRLVGGPGDANVVVGSLVHLSTPTEVIEGRVLALSTDSLIVEALGQRRAVTRTQIQGLRVDVGQQSKWAQGWAIGLASGAGLGIVTGFASGDDHNGSDIQLNADQKALLLGIGLGVLGSTIGAAIGAATRQQTWAHGRWPERNLSLELAPVFGDRLGVRRASAVLVVRAHYGR